ncbi:hypothetical protein E1A91_D07G162100v1 [Gossypium mustelinum]|uniref:Uncharacterized protein n=1 Tax=Gossypium mustelinum TaxID=34275 RepID=A0A5D2UA09_GOSMU|nr:hypothetical protein E1A91_D07G162100v1 [Gossypium mustelinum]
MPTERAKIGPKVYGWEAVRGQLEARDGATCVANGSWEEESGFCAHGERRGC